MKAVTLLALLAALLAVPAAQARPERIVPGISYYSDDFSVREGVAELGAEKNLEEVFQFYNYYEAIYDEAGRIVEFKAYRRGEVERSESYVYGADGKPERKIVRHADGRREVIPLPPAPAGRKG